MGKIIQHSGILPNEIDGKNMSTRIANILSDDQLSPDQMKKIALVFSDPSDAQGNGLHFESKRYVFNKIEDIENIPVMHSKSVWLQSFIYISSHPTLLCQQTRAENNFRFNRARKESWPHGAKLPFSSRITRKIALPVKPSTSSTDKLNTWFKTTSKVAYARLYLLKLKVEWSNLFFFCSFSGREKQKKIMIIVWLLF